MQHFTKGNDYSPQTLIFQISNPDISTTWDLPLEIISYIK